LALSKLALGLDMVTVGLVETWDVWRTEKSTLRGRCFDCFALLLFLSTTTAAAVAGEDVVDLGLAMAGAGKTICKCMSNGVGGAEYSISIVWYGSWVPDECLSISF